MEKFFDFFNQNEKVANFKASTSKSQRRVKDPVSLHLGQNLAERELKLFFKCVGGWAKPRASFESCQNFGIETDNFGSSNSPEFLVKNFLK